MGMVFAAFFIGFVVALTPGPVTLASAQRAIARGFRPAFSFSLGSLSADTFYALLVYFGLSGLLAGSALFRLLLWGLGGAWLIWLGISAIRTHIEPLRVDAIDSVPPWRHFRAGLLLTLLNPLTIVSWVALAGNFFALWNVDWPPVAQFGLIAIMAMVLGVLSWVLIMISTLSLMRRVISVRAIHWLSAASGVILILYGLGAWWSGLRLILVKV